MRSTAICVTAIIAVAALAVLLISGCQNGIPGIVQTTPSNETMGAPISPAVISVTFNEEMIRSSVEDSFSISPTVGTQRPTFTWSNNDKTVVAALPQNLQPNTNYKVTIGSGAKSKNNIAMGRPAEFSFTTGPATVAGAGAGTTAEPAPPPAPEITFAEDIKPLAEERCDGCHSGMATGKMSVYENAIKYVTPNDTEKSLYYVRPIGNNHPNAWGDKANTVRDWINAGAPR